MRIPSALSILACVLLIAPPAAATVTYGQDYYWIDTDYNVILGNTRFQSTVSQSGGGTNGQSNTGLGWLVLNANTTGQANTAVGYDALLVDTTGAYNTALGFNTLALNTTGSNNTVLGYNVASTTLNGGSNDILIGTSSAVDTPAAGTSYYLNIGNTITGTLAAGAGGTALTIGTTSDDGAIMTFAGTGAITLPAGNGSQRPGSAVNGMIRYNSDSSGAVEAYINGSWAPLLTSGGTAWSSLTNATANLTLANAGYGTTFNQTSPVNWTWANTTPATSSTVGNAPVLTTGGTYWNGSASAAETLTSTLTTGTGANGEVIQEWNLSGSTGSPSAISILYEFAGNSSTASSSHVQLLAGSVYVGAQNNPSYLGLWSGNSVEVLGQIGNQYTGSGPIVAVGHDRNNINPTSGTTVGIALGNGTSDQGGLNFDPSSGSAKLVAVNVSPTINQTGTANGDYTALQVNVTETSATGTNKLLEDLQTGGTSEFRVTDAGNVGIITAAPQSTLSVNGGVAIGTTYAGTNAAGSNNLIVQGNVGIGTVSPGANLQINANETTAAMVLRDTVQNANASFSFTAPIGSAPDLTISAGRVIFPGYTRFSGGQMEFAGMSTINATGAMNWFSNWGGTLSVGVASGLATLSVIGRGGSSGDDKIGLIVAAPPYATKDIMRWTTNAGSILGVINASGSVGIGTTSPQATLDVNGYARLTLQSSQPVACAAGNAGAIALNHLAQMCACNGSSWIFADSVGAACSW